MICVVLRVTCHVSRVNLDSMCSRAHPLTCYPCYREGTVCRCAWSSERLLWRGAARVGHFVLFRFCARAGSQQLSHRDALLKNLEGIKASDAGHLHRVRVLS